MSQIILLGPQRLNPTIDQVLPELDLGNGSLAVITAGWQEREGEVDELADHVRRPIVNLRLHERAERLFAEVPEVFQALRQRQTRLRALQRLHRLRLDFVLEPARILLRREAPTDLLAAERRDAIEAVRALDRHHVERLRQIHTEFEEQWGSTIDDATAADRREIADILGTASAIAIAGGHVAVLLNRLRLFRFRELRGDLPIVAWSAGAMVLGSSVVLFHDRPPQGAGNPEVLELGLGLFEDLLPLPHASYRLRLEDPVRVSLFAQRFAPARCVALDPGSRARHDSGGWSFGNDTRLLRTSGEVTVEEETS